MSKAKVYVTKGGTKIHNPKLFVFATTSKTGNVTDRYMIKGTSDEGSTKTSFIAKADVSKWGKPERMTAKPAKARKSCKTKYEECEAKKSSKRSAKKKTAKKSPKKEEEESEEESLELKEESQEELESPESSSSEEEKPKRKPKTSKTAKARKPKARKQK
jgi:hypothetical protein